MNFFQEENLGKTFLFKLKKSTIALILIFLIAFFLRIVFFNGLQWDDDPDYVWRAQQVLTGEGFFYSDNNGFRTGTYFPAALAYMLFGINNFAAGAYALVISLLSIIAIFLLGKLLFNIETGLIAALLLAFYPLDIELASRLMPDGLLAGFSLFTVYFLFKGDIKNRDSDKESLVSIKSYVASGLLLGWCTLVNMSSFPLIIFFAVYFFFSIFFFKNKIKRTGFLKGFFKILVLRFAILVGAFLLIAAVEGAFYQKFQGDFFLKHKNTLTHYGEEHGFNKDLSMYPRIMFHLSSKGTFQFQGKENSLYGFYWLFAFFALIYGLTQYKKGTYFINIWLLVVWLYMQWGSMSFSEYSPFHRLPRHLSIVTPAMILCLAFFLGNFRPKEIKKYMTPVILIFLVISSLSFSYHRHKSLEDAVLPQEEIHNYLEFLKPKIVYAANNTVAYQKFLDKFKDKGRQYMDIRSASSNRSEEAYAIIGEHRNWGDTARIIWPNQNSVPENWELTKELQVEGRLNRSPFNVRVYKLLTIPIPELKVRNYEKTRQFLEENYPADFREGAQLILSWECAKLDGIDELIIQDDQVTLNHLEFMPPEEVNYRLFQPIPNTPVFIYRIIKEQGRGAVTIIEQPSQTNDFTLKILIDDGIHPAQDFYRFFVVAKAKE